MRASQKSTERKDGLKKMQVELWLQAIIRRQLPQVTFQQYHEIFPTHLKSED